jgi:hypothetical protein
MIGISGAEAAWFSGVLMRRLMLAAARPPVPFNRKRRNGTSMVRSELRFGEPAPGSPFRVP